MNQNFMRVMSRVLILSTLSMSLWAPNSQAVMVSSEEAMIAQSVQAERMRIRSLLERADVREQLQAKGISADAAVVRVDALTDEEVASIANKLDNLPAGGDIIGTVVFIFLVLLVTDILGFTKVFPFTRSVHK